MNDKGLLKELSDLLCASDELLSPKIDFVFKLLFGTEENKALLTQFLKATLDIPHEDYDTVLLQNPILSKDYPDDKYGILDVKLKTKNGSVINIEIQVLDIPHYESRILFYLSKMIHEQLKSGEQYSRIAKTISISILNFDLIKDSSAYRNVYHLYDKKTHSTFTELLEVVTLELPKLPKENDGNAAFPWLKFLDVRDKEDAMTTLERYPELKPAYEELQKISLDSTRRQEYERRLKWYLDAVNLRDGSREEGLRQGLSQGLQQGMLQGIQEGLLQGIQQEKHESALKLKKLGLSDEVIEKATGLSLQEISTL